MVCNSPRSSTHVAGCRGTLLEHGPKAASERLKRLHRVTRGTLIYSQDSSSVVGAARAYKGGAAKSQALRRNAKDACTCDSRYRGPR